ncbi:hypothetical protein [Bradyrhizobium sp. 151]|uniref:hypothetical protein n=1 Tax=Bradyrhizobium sp. 151 TaxID=2782626 RepID=UPI001FFBAC8E|nr:hypothetical protein [Bradyrhizobium sp. 151]MCK1661267.1 hypothetical protein [Bradyrhizobium sp. 151]
MPHPRSLEEQVLHRFSYAVGLFHGAENTCRFGDARIATYGIPTFLLLGFSLENAFASYLMACEHKNYGDYKKGHDLLAALKACRLYGLFFAPVDVQLVEKLTPHHKNFVFRYPEKMERVDLGPFRPVLRSSKNIIRDVEVGLKIRGFDPRAIVDALPDE